MQTPPKMDMVVIKDYYQMTPMDENVNWMKLTHMLLNSLQTSWPLFIHLPLL